MRGSRCLLTSVLTPVWLTSPRGYHHRILNGITGTAICKTRQFFILSKITFFKIMPWEQQDMPWLVPCSFFSVGKCPWIILLSYVACHGSRRSNFALVQCFFCSVLPSHTYFQVNNTILCIFFYLFECCYFVHFFKLVHTFDLHPQITFAPKLIVTDSL